MPIKVLVVDDDEAIRILLGATLADDRIELFQASDGQEALELARQEHPKLIVLDLLMPRMDGFAVCAALKGDPATADIKILVLTALAQSTDRELALEAGADILITKPFSPIALLRVVKEALESD